MSVYLIVFYVICIILSPALVEWNVSDNLGQLALLYNMTGAYEKALALLHRRLVIHEKFGPGQLLNPI